MSIYQNFRSFLNIVYLNNITYQIKKSSKSNLIYNRNYTSYKYENIENFASLYFKSKCVYLKEFYDDLDEFKKIDSKDNYRKTKSIYDASSDLYHEMLGDYFKLYE